MTSYNYQNAFCCKLCYADLCHAWALLHKRKNTEYNSLPQSILVVVVEWRHHANVLFLMPYPTLLCHDVTSSGYDRLTFPSVESPEVEAAKVTDQRYTFYCISPVVCTTNCGPANLSPVDTGARGGRDFAATCNVRGWRDFAATWSCAGDVNLQWIDIIGRATWIWRLFTSSCTDYINFPLFEIVCGVTVANYQT